MKKDVSVEILSDLTVYTKYARYIPQLRRRETWEENSRRDEEMHVGKFPQLEGLIREAFSMDREKRVLASMRSHQFGGRPIILNNARIYNCSFINITRAHHFSEILFLLLSGTGVGFSVRRRHISCLPDIKEPRRAKKFVIGDSIEGWADAVRALMRAYLQGKALPLFDYSDIRPKGAALVTSGGKAPGPEPLRSCLEKVHAILRRKPVGSRLGSLEVHDIVCHLADAVLSGGIRRAALISIFDPDDSDMLGCKGDLPAEPVNGFHWNPNREEFEGPARHGGMTQDVYLSREEMDRFQQTGCLPWYWFHPQRARANNSACLQRNSWFGGNVKITREGYQPAISPDSPEGVILTRQGWYRPKDGDPNTWYSEFLPAATREDFDRIWAQCVRSGAGEPGVMWTNHPDYGTNPCITGDAMIETENGQIAMRDLVDSVNRGDAPRVYSYDEKTGKVVIDVVNGGMLTRRKAAVVRLTMDDGSVLELTPDHRVYTENRGWVEAAKLTQEDVLIQFIPSTSDMETSKTVRRAAISRIEIVDNQDVYDISVQDNHSFFANGLLVHNCGEISLFGGAPDGTDVNGEGDADGGGQFCNLTEVDLSACQTQADLLEAVRAATIIGTLQAAYTDFHYLSENWRRNCESDALLGVSLTGVADCDYTKFDLAAAAAHAARTNGEVAALIGVRPSSRVTCVKPSGTAALVLGCSSGIHGRHSDYYIRRMRFNKNEAIAAHLMAHHPELLEDEFNNPLGIVVSIPQKSPEGSIMRSEAALETLQRVKHFNTTWVAAGHQRGPNTHNVSCTINVRDGEWDQVGEWMWENREHYAGIACYPFSDANYKQAPYEETDEATFLEMFGHLQAIDLTAVTEASDNTALAEQVACAGNACEIL